MDTLENMRAFVTVVNQGSFSLAADQLGKSPQLISKYVAHLEARLDTRLLTRTTRNLSLTEAGAAYFNRCQQILWDIDDMEAAMSHATQQAKGRLKINAPMSFGITHLTPAIAAFQYAQPGITVDLTLNDREVDIVAEGYDLALRISQLKDSNLVAKKLCPIRLLVCASQMYLEQFGTPQTPEELANHRCLHYTYQEEKNTWSFTKDGKDFPVKVNGHFNANNGDALRLAALAGGGLILQPTFIVGKDIQAGKLKAVLTDYTPKQLNLYAVYAHRQYLSAKVRLFIDFLAQYFSDTPYWEP